MHTPKLFKEKIKLIGIEKFDIILEKNFLGKKSIKLEILIKIIKSSLLYL